jgi:hypothetical protein
MKSSVRLVAVLTVVAVGGCIGTSEMSQTREDEIEYRGEKIKLTKRYSDYDEYRNDPNNLDPSELSRVERLVCEAPIASSFADRWQMLQAILGLTFPGYGHWQFGDKTQADGSVLSGFGIQVPRANKARILVFRSRGKGFDLLDDFVAPFDDSIDRMIMNVTLKDKKLIYSNIDTIPILTRDTHEKSQ